MPDDLAEQIDTVARTIYGEARGEHGYEPLIAVAWVIKNRADFRDKDGHEMWWGGTPAKVCLKAQQFSCWNMDDPNLPIIQAATLNQPRFAQCFGVACQVLTGDEPADPTGKATHYHAAGIPAPWWAQAMTFTVQIGSHRFYR